MENPFTKTSYENALETLNYENKKHGRFFNSEEECISFYSKKHNLNIFYILLFFYVLFAVLDCYSYYKNFGESYKLLAYLFFIFGIAFSVSFSLINFFKSDLIKQIRLIFLGTDVLFVLYFAYLPFIDDFLLYRDVGGEFFIRGDSIKYSIIILAVISFYLSVKKVINKFSFINEIVIHNLIEENKRNKNKLNELQQPIIKTKTDNDNICNKQLTNQSNIEISLEKLSEDRGSTLKNYLNNQQQISSEVLLILASGLDYQDIMTKNHKDILNQLENKFTKDKPFIFKGEKIYFDENKWYFYYTNTKNELKIRLYKGKIKDGTKSLSNAISIVRSIFNEINL